MKKTLFLFVLLAVVGMAPARADVLFGASFGGDGHGHHYRLSHHRHGFRFHGSFYHPGPSYYYAPSPVVACRPPVVVTPAPVVTYSAPENRHKTQTGPTRTGSGKGPYRVPREEGGGSLHCRNV